MSEVGYTLRSAYRCPRPRVLYVLIRFVQLENIVVVDAAKEPKHGARCPWRTP
jgi:hypothetical protein